MERPETATYPADEIDIAKVAWACSIARKERIDYVWIDTCCINKSPTADIRELSQAINSMFRWYKEAQVCYALLLDVSMNPVEYQAPPKVPKNRSEYERRIGSFEESVWFERGWTLQELLAPENLAFSTTSGD